MNRDNSVLGLLQQSIITINAKNTEIEKLQEENKRLKEKQPSTNVSINFYSVPEGVDPIDLIKNMSVQLEKEI